VARSKPDRLRKSGGIEIGFGCLAPTVLGPGLRLDGALGQAPTWLFDAIVPRPRAKRGASR
jgi:hypothetical protein